MTNLSRKEKKTFQSQPNRHISSRSKIFCTGGAKMWRFSGRMWQKTSQVKKHIFVCESVTFFPEMWQMWRVTFFGHRKKGRMWRHSPEWVSDGWVTSHLSLFWVSDRFFLEKKKSEWRHSPKSVTGTWADIRLRPKKKSMWRHSPKCVTGTWADIRLRPTLRHWCLEWKRPVAYFKETCFVCKRNLWHVWKRPMACVKETCGIL